MALTLCPLDVKSITLATYATYMSDLDRNHHGSIVIHNKSVSLGCNRYDETSINGKTIHAEESAISKPIDQSNLGLGLQYCLLSPELQRQCFEKCIYNLRCQEND